MKTQQQIAIDNHCRFAFETAQPRFARVVKEGQLRMSVVLTVNSGHE